MDREDNRREENRSKRSKRTQAIASVASHFQKLQQAMASDWMRPLIGKNKSEMVVVNTPSGEKNFEILDVEYI